MNYKYRSSYKGIYEVANNYSQDIYLERKYSLTENQLPPQLYQKHVQLIER